MTLSKNLKRKVDTENRAYKEEWKDNYAFILPSLGMQSWCVLSATKLSLFANNIILDGTTRRSMAPSKWPFRSKQRH